MDARTFMSGITLLTRIFTIDINRVIEHIANRKIY